MLLPILFLIIPVAWITGRDHVKNLINKEIKARVTQKLEEDLGKAMDSLKFRFYLFLGFDILLLMAVYFNLYKFTEEFLLIYFFVFVIQFLYTAYGFINFSSFLLFPKIRINQILKKEINNKRKDNLPIDIILGVLLIDHQDFYESTLSFIKEGLKNWILVNWLKIAYLFARWILLYELVIKKHNPLISNLSGMIFKAISSIQSFG